MSRGVTDASGKRKGNGSFAHAKFGRSFGSMNVKGTVPLGA